MLLATLAIALLPAQEGWEARAPALDAPPRTAYEAESEGGLRYLWWLPEDAAEVPPRSLTVILHGTGGDYRWGAWNNPMEVFRPQDVVLSVDGTSPGQGDSRLFLGKPEDAEAFRAFLEEMRTAFGVTEVYLYGHSQGGFFVVYYAGEFPDTVDGVVAHASGAWNWSKTGRAVQRVPIAFLHGTGDPVVPYRQSPGAFAAYREEGFEMLHLRRMEGYNHWPNATRATEALDWCQGMATADPAVALARVESLLRPKGMDQYQYEQPPDWAGARMVLRRLQGDGPGAFAEEAVPAKLARAVAKHVEEVEDAAEEQVKALRKAVGKKLDPEDDDLEWVGRLLAVRADFRGCDALDEWLDDIGWERARKREDRAVREIFDVWWDDGVPRAEKLETVLDALPDAFLYDGWPSGFESTLREWLDQADDLDLPRKAKKSLPVLEAWLDGLRDGRKEYRKDWPRP